MSMCLMPDQAWSKRLASDKENICKLLPAYKTNTYGFQVSDITILTDLFGVVLQ